jgi:tetratricopeptide (TPR) repeat protein
MYYPVATIAVLFIILLWSQMMFSWHGLFWAFWGCLFFGLAAQTIFATRRSIKVVSFLKEGFIHKFDEEIDKDIKRIRKSRYRDCLKVNKTAGLFYLGRFDEALHILSEINGSKLPGKFKILYVNNKLANLTQLEKIEEAERLVNEHKDVFTRFPGDQKLHYALRGNLANLEFFKGDLIKSRIWLEECLQANDSKSGQSVIHYYLGLIDQKELKNQDAQNHFLKSVEAAPESIFAQKAKERLT